MNRISLVTLILLMSYLAFGQPKTTADQKPKGRAIPDNAIVIDSSGNVYTADIWRKLILTGYYDIRPETNSLDTRFFLVRVSEELRMKRLAASPRPIESSSFITGEAVKTFTAFDLEGNKIKLKDLKGKIVVINFWFINCPPCRTEIFELNKLVSDYKDSADIVFLGIALDESRALETF